MSKLTVLLCMVILIVALTATAQADDRVIGVNKSDSGSPGSRAPTPVPEPATMALLAGGLAGLYGLKKKLGKD